MGRQTTVWAHTPLEALQGRTGVVACDQGLADTLIASGEVQDPRVGGFALKTIRLDVPVYQTKQLQAAAPQTQTSKQNKVHPNNKRGK